MNYKLLAAEIRGLAEGDVDSEITLADMTDEQVVRHLITCPCCEEQTVTDGQIRQMVTEATSLEDFIDRANDAQRNYPATDEEYQIVRDIVSSAFNSAVKVIARNRGILDLDGVVVDVLADSLAQQMNDGYWCDMVDVNGNPVSFYE